MKFGLGNAFDELASVGGTAAVVLRRAELRMFAMSDADFGGYVTLAPRRGGAVRGGDRGDGRNDDVDVDDVVNDWNEEDVAWSSVTSTRMAAESGMP